MTTHMKTVITISSKCVECEPTCVAHQYTMRGCNKKIRCDNMHAISLKRDMAKKIPLDSHGGPSS
jgi:hypothetical protein